MDDHHGIDSQQEYLDYINQQHDKINSGARQVIPFLDIPVKGRPLASWDTVSTRRHTLIDLHGKCNHYPAQKRWVMETLVRRTLTLAVDDNRQENIDLLDLCFYQMNTLKNCTHRAVRPRRNQQSLRIKSLQPPVYHTFSIWT